MVSQNADRRSRVVASERDRTVRGENRRRACGFVDDRTAARARIDDKDVAAGSTAAREIGGVAAERDVEAVGTDCRAEVGGGVALRAVGKRRDQLEDRV